MNLSPGITLAPFLHGNLEYAREVRRLFASARFDCVVVDLPPAFDEELPAAVDNLPFISAVIARGVEDPVYYIPTDPCDAAIEAIRQARQSRLHCVFAGYPELYAPAPQPPLPDAYALRRLGPDAYGAICLQVIGKPEPDSSADRDGRHIAHVLRDLEAQHHRILALIHFRHIAATAEHFHRERSYNTVFPATPGYALESSYVNPDHLYFALGELPFVAGRCERERLDPFAQPVEITEAVKDLFRETREDYYEEKNPAIELSPARMQVALTFVRNLTIMSGGFIPSLPDVVAAAKGVGGNGFAVRILKSAKYYPFLPVEQTGPFTGIGIDKITCASDGTTHRAVNLLRDVALVWRTLPIKAEPSLNRMRNYRYRWNPTGMCSHVPEDRRIENFNTHVRHKALRILSEDLVRTERFTASAKDGIDIRETLRNWHTGDIYVKDIPPSRGNVDTVVIIFDADHDEKYPHCATWSAEHDQESTLTFYATDPFADLIGPGIARSRYGGLSLLFPPRHIPNSWELTADLNLNSLAERLIYGATIFSGQPTVACISARRPSLRVRTLARAQRKHLLWVPISSFSSETLRRLRQFHVLNGRIVRSWAAHFIGD